MTVAQILLFVLADLSRLPPEDEGNVLIGESTESATYLPTESATYLPRDVRLHKV
jgi:hypothetical protein